MTKTFDLMTEGQLTSAIHEIKTTGKAFEDLIHRSAVSALAIVRDSGNWTLAANLMNALPMGVRRNGLAFWFDHFSNGKLKFVVDNETRAFRGKLMPDRAVTDFDVPAAMLTTFADLAPEPKAKTQSIEDLIKGLERTANNDKVNADGSPRVAPETRAVAASLVASYRRAQLKVAVAA